MLDQKHLRETEARCTQEAAPLCQDVCPFRMDVRAFMAHMQKGKMVQARAVLERHLPLAAIVARICDHPCENVCLRRDLGGSLAVHSLEECCIQAAARPQPLVRRAKNGTLAVLGTGLGGLVAAFDIHRKGFSVSVFHEGQPQDALLRRFPALDALMVEDELAVLAREGLCFVRATLDSNLQAQAVADFNAVCIDADAAPALAVNKGAVDAVTLHLTGTLCQCGWASTTPTGHSYASASEQAGEGRRAALTLERLLTGASLSAARPDSPDGRRLHTVLDGIEAVPRVLPAAKAWTAAECATEAARCLQCQCMACVRECAYLQKYNEYPRTYARQIHNNAAIVKGQHMANSLVNGCTLCGQCTEICPERFSMADLCLTARRDMVERGKMPPSAHEFALEDMHSAIEDNALFLADPTAGNHSAPTWALMPGCQLWALRPQQLRALHAYVSTVLPKGESLGLILSCCGIPARWSGREALFQKNMADFRSRWEALGSPRLICACSSCLGLFRAELPEIFAISLWEMLAAVPETTQQAAQRNPAIRTVSIHDPCTARHNSGWQQAVRALVRGQGINVHEPRRSGVETPCCGYGGLVWNAQASLADSISAHRAEQLPHTGLVSCIMCWDRLMAQGKNCLHVLDILPATAALAPDEAAPRPGLSARRAAREALRRSLRREWLGQDVPEPADSRVCIAPELLNSLEARHILLQDVEQAVLGVEAKGRCFQDVQSGQCMGAWTPRHVTFWVQYSVTEQGYKVHDAWCHRMRVPDGRPPASLDYPEEPARMDEPARTDRPNCPDGKERTEP